MVKITRSKESHQGLKVDHIKKKTDFPKEPKVKSTTILESRKHIDPSDKEKTNISIKLTNLLRSNCYDIFTMKCYKSQRNKGNS